MQSNDTIESSRISRVESEKLHYRRVTAVLAGTAGVLVEPGRHPASIIRSRATWRCS